MIDAHNIRASDARPDPAVTVDHAVVELILIAEAPVDRVHRRSDLHSYEFSKHNKYSPFPNTRRYAPYVQIIRFQISA